ncbi:MAG: acetylglutamate kinase [Bacteroidales bacterium]|nr:acetylglutamate kinase [Bacteroidales bacterium]
MITVIKIGGNVIDDETALKVFCERFAAMPGLKVLVHGGGVAASRLQKSLGQEPRMVEGRRVTDSDALEAVTMAYAGWCNKHICALLQSAGCNAIGLSGCDASVITAKKRPPISLSDGSVQDYGFVGDVTPASVNAGILEKFIGLGLVPVLCAINHDGKGLLLNTNADTVAASVASALKAELVCCLELPGVLSDIADKGSVMKCISSDTFESMKKDGSIAGGMIPKISNCLRALREGASSARITGSESFGKAGAGTEVVL